MWKVVLAEHGHGLGTARTVHQAGSAEAGRATGWAWAARRGPVSVGRAHCCICGEQGRLDRESAEAAWEPCGAGSRDGWEPFQKQGQRDPWPVSGCGGKGGILSDVWAVALGRFWEAQAPLQTQAAPGVGGSREGQLVVLWLEAPVAPPGQRDR